MSDTAESEPSTSAGCSGCGELDSAEGRVVHKVRVVLYVGAVACPTQQRAKSSTRPGCSGCRGHGVLDSAESRVIHEVQVVLDVGAVVCPTQQRAESSTRARLFWM